jgi:hypothetical protein
MTKTPYLPLVLLPNTDGVNIGPAANSRAFLNVEVELWIRDFFHTRSSLKMFSKDVAQERKWKQLMPRVVPIRTRHPRLA